MRVSHEGRKLRLKPLVACTILAMVMATPAAAATINFFNENFDAALGANWTGTKTITAVPAGYAALGFSGSMLRNDTVSPIVPTTLTLTGLPTHTGVDINFLLAIIDSWDGINGNPGPDTFVVQVDGVTRVSQVFAIQSGTDGPGAPADLGPLQDRGFSGFNDRGFNMGNVSALNFAHSSSTLVINFFTLDPGWQGTTDESWGLDNLSIDLITSDTAPPSVVPEPATLSLVGLALFGGASRARRNRSKNGSTNG